jgi:hypothetical protein
MKRCSILIVALVIAIAMVFISTGTVLSAINWQSFDAGVTDKKEDGTRVTLTLKDSQNHTFKVTYQDEATAEKLADKIIKYKNLFYNWQQSRLKEVDFVISPSFLEIIIIPQEIMHNKANLAGVIPAGITMTYYPDKDVLRYDFRIMKDNLLMRIYGDYRTEDEMTGKLFYAYDNPLLYLRRGDPEALIQEIEELKEKLEKLRQAFIYLNNEDWINRYKIIPQENILKIIEIKNGNPKITEKELWKELKKQKIKITKHELKLVLILYFNEF